VLVDVLITIGKAIVVVVIWLAIGVPGLIYAERKIVADIQDRIGPKRVGPLGLLQPIADAVKLILKEDLTPKGADKVIFNLAPVLVFAPPLIAAAALPFGGKVSIFGRVVSLQVADINVGLLFVIAMSSMTVYGVVLGGWASNSKYSLLGSIRSAAQMISYELAMGLAMVGVFIVVGSLRAQDIVAAQSTLPMVAYVWAGGKAYFPQIFAFLIFLLAMMAETNRHPFDFPEAESEIVAGYHTEYSSFKFASFFMGEYMGMMTMAALCVTLFLGGWLWPGPLFTLPAYLNWIWGPFWFLAKIFVFMYLYIWMRGTFPRLRYDILQRFGWKVLLPAALVNILVTSLFVALQ
jgi:NADH-quinone oxidoreductase subunit H